MSVIANNATTAADIYGIYNNYMSKWEIPLHNVISYAADGAPAMMGRRQGCLKLMKNDNPGMMTVHCVIHRENLVAQNLSPELHLTMRAVIKCVNAICNAKRERLFKAFCEELDEAHMRLIFYDRGQMVVKSELSGSVR